MAELSQETQAILDRLKAEGDLLRNSGTNSIKQVNIKLDKFQGLFQTISDNIAEQARVMGANNRIQAEALESSRTQEQLSEIEEKERDTPDEASSDKGYSKTNETIDKIGDKISSALTLKNIALAGAGAFVGYNLLKGFVDERTGGGFTEFENNFGSFSRSLKDINVRETIEEFKDSMSKLRKTIDDFKEQLDGIKEALGDPLWWASAIAGFFGAISVLRSVAIIYQSWVMSRMNDPDVKTNPEPPRTGIPDPENPQQPDTPKQVEPPRTGVPGANGANDPAPNKTPPSQPETPPRTSPAPNPPSGRNNPPKGGNFLERDTTPAETGRRANGQFASKAEIEQAFKDQRMKRIYLKLVKGLGVIGIVLEVYQLAMLWRILNAPSDPSDPNYVSDEDKIGAVGDTIGGFIGAVGGLSAGASVGAFFGPWGALILGVIGAGLGAWAGGYIGELIAKWAFDESVTSNDRAKTSAMINASNPDYYQGYGSAYGYENLSQQDYLDMYAPGGSAYGINNTPDYMKYLDPNYNSGGGASTPAPLQYGGRGRMFERPGERQLYQRQRDAAMLDALIHVHEQQNQQKESMDRIMAYLGVPNDSSRAGQIAAASAGNNAGGTTIVNAPVIAPSNVTSTQGDTSVSQLSLSGGSGGGSAGSVYGFTDVFN